MCLSAEVSFGAAALLIPARARCINRAYSRTGVIFPSRALSDRPDPSSR
jgi:hypothetical protein